MPDSPKSQKPRRGSSLDPFLVEEVARRKQNGMTGSEIADELDVDENTVWNAMRKIRRDSKYRTAGSGSFDLDRLVLANDEVTIRVLSTGAYEVVLDGGSMTGPPAKTVFSALKKAVQMQEDLLGITEERQHSRSNGHSRGRKRQDDSRDDQLPDVRE